MCLLKLSDRNFCLASAVRFKRSISLISRFLFEMGITDLKNGHVIPKFWVLENFSIQYYYYFTNKKSITISKTSNCESKRGHGYGSSTGTGAAYGRTGSNNLIL